MNQSPFTIARFVCLATAMLLVAGCFYPSVKKPPHRDEFQTVVPVPYDLAWGAVHKVVADNNYSISAQNPNRGIMEVEGGGFTLKDANCGKVTGIVGKVAAEPGAASTSVYNFHLAPDGPEASVIGVQATFRAPIQVPLHPTRSVNCVSSGRQERRLLKELRSVAATLHRPPFKHPEAARSSTTNATGHGT